MDTETISMLKQKIEERKRKHRIASAKWRQNNKDKIKEQNANYNQKRKREIEEIEQEEMIVQPQETIVNFQEIFDKYPEDTIPFFKSKKIQELKPVSINGYVYKTNAIHKKLLNKQLPEVVREELKKLFNNKEFDEKIIIDEFTYINNDIKNTVIQLRKLYQNDNTFRGYINVIGIITAHLQSLDQSVYQILSKINKFYVNEIKEQRKDNQLSKKNEGKLIDLDRDIILSNLDKLENKEDRLIFGLYTLFPARRLDWRLMKITTSKQPIKDQNNYLIIGKKKTVVFNTYKSSNTYEQQIFQIDDKVLDKLFNEYLLSKTFRENDYLFRNKKNNLMSSSLFGKKIMDTFEKVYGKRIGATLLRSSWAIWINKQPLSIKQKEEYMNKMAHSFNESQLYVKI